MNTYLDHQNFVRLLDLAYSDEAMLRARLMGANRQYPSGYFDIVRFFGPGAIAPDQVRVLRKSGQFEFSNSLVAQYSQIIESQLRTSGRMYDGPLAMKLVSAKIVNGDGEVCVQPADYGDQAGSCFALDFPSDLFSEHGGTLRGYLLNLNPHHELETNPLAVCLGVAAYAVVIEQGAGYLLQVERSGKLASLENSLGPSVAGSVDWEASSTNLGELLTRALESETREELGWEPREYELVPLVYAREILRGERPQLFAYLKTELSRSEIAQRIETKCQSEREIANFTFLPLADRRLSQDQIAPLNFEAKAAYYLLEEALALK